MNTDPAGAAGDHLGHRGRQDGPARRRPGELSGLVLDVLRQAGRPLTAGEVAGRLPVSEAAPLAYTTVVTILSRLRDQGLAERFRTGRAYAYLAVADQAQLAARRMRRVLDSEDDHAAVLARFVGGLNTRDEKLLRELLGPDLGSGSQTGSGPPGRDG